MTLFISDFSFTSNAGNKSGMKNVLRSICGEYDVFQEIEETDDGFVLEYYDLEDEEYDAISEQLLDLPEKFAAANADVNFSYEVFFDVSGIMYCTMASYKAGKLLKYESNEGEERTIKGYIDSGKLILEEIDMDEYVSLGGPRLC